MAFLRAGLRGALSFQLQRKALEAGSITVTRTFTSKHTMGNYVDPSDMVCSEFGFLNVVVV